MCLKLVVYLLYDEVAVYAIAKYNRHLFDGLRVDERFVASQYGVAQITSESCISRVSEDLSSSRSSQLPH